MKAVVRNNYCKAEDLSLSDIPYPQIKDDEVLVRINYTTINRTDCANLTAKPFIMRFVLGIFKPRKKTVGTDFAGDIVELGGDAKCFKLDDKVFGFKDIVAESQAEFAVFKERDLFLIPECIEKDVAAASLEGAHYAFTFFKLANKRLILRKMVQYKIPNSLRLTIGSEQANKHFMQAIGSIIK